MEKPKNENSTPWKPCDTYRLNLNVTGDVEDSDNLEAKFKSMPGRRDAGNRPRGSEDLS